MAMSGSVTDGSDGDCGGRSRVTIVFAWIARFTKWGPRAAVEWVNLTRRPLSDCTVGSEA